MPPFRVAALEIPVRYGDVAHTLGVIDRALARIRSDPHELPDLVLLPETCLTGYVSPRGDFDLRRFAEPIHGPTASALSSLAARHGVALGGPLIESHARRYYNALLLFDHAGELRGRWRKRHPWVPERWAAPGNLGTPVVEIAGARITAGICYDLHFMADDAPGALTASDVFLFPSAWVERPPETRPALLSELAREFGVAVVNANWGPSVPRLPGQGNSMIFDATGACVARAQDERDGDDGEDNDGVRVVRAEIPIAG